MKKKWLAGILAAVLLMGSLPAQALAEGAPEEAVPYGVIVPGIYEINNLEDLKKFGQSVIDGRTYIGETVTLKADIDLSPEYGEDKDSWTPIGGYGRPFRGTFDGGGHAITGLYINKADREYQGLFGYVDSNGSREGGRVQSLTVSGDVTGGSHVGGIIGFLGNGGTVVDCHYSGRVSGKYYTGGMVGHVDASQGSYSSDWGVIRCSNAGEISGINSGTGGVVGCVDADNASNCSVIECCNTGKISGDYNVGGVIGSFEADTASNCGVTGCYNTGEISGENNIGGVIGMLYDSKIANCYNTGNVSGSSEAGGLVGDKYNGGSVTDSYYLNTCGAAGDGEGKSAGAFSSGEVAWLLQGGNDGEAAELVWGQALETDRAPVLTGESGKRVYHVDIIGSDGKPAVGYRNKGGPATIPAGGSVQIGTVPNTTVITLPNGGKVTLNEDGSVDVHGSATIKTGDGPEVKLPQGGTIGGDGEITIPGGGAAQVGNSPVTTITVPESGGTIQPKPDGTVDVPGGSTVQTGENGPEVTIGPGNSGTVGGDGGITVPDGGTVQIGKDPVTTITPPTGGEVTPNPDGTVTVPEGTTVKPGNGGPEITVGPGNGGTVGGDGGVTVEGGENVKVGDTTVTLPEGGGTVKPNLDGTIPLPGGTVVTPTGKDPITVPDGGGAVNPGTGEVTLNVHTVTFDSQGGSAVNPIKVTHGKIAAQPGNPTRSGYAFGGWYKESGCTNAWNFATDTVTGDITLYAKWTQNSGGGGGWYNPPSVTTYPVTTPATFPHGKLTISPVRAERNATVTITVAPEDGYRLGVLNVTSGGKSIPLTEKGGGKYAFTMPEGTVKVEATFVPAETPGTPWINPFADVPEGAWYYDAVRFVSENGLMGGYGNGQFGVNDNLSRAQLAQILFNKEGRPIVNYLLQYGDVSTGTWYTEAVRWATSQGIVGGYGNGNFGPNDPITREQLAVMLWRYSGSPAATNKELHFNDTDEISDFALEALRWAVENGIINGYGDGRLGPQGQATRAQVAQMLMNFLER